MRLFINLKGQLTKTMIGFLNVYKPAGLSSAKVVSGVKKHFHLDKVGHMGTLDPLASGILPIAVGKATRMFDYFLDKTKTYIARFTFGKETTTLDAEGEIVATSDTVPTLSEIESALCHFIGEINQLPPSYSAKKINGTCAYKLARQNVEFTLKPKKILVKEFKLLGQISADTFEFEIACGSGTYIRSLARDLACALGSKGYMSALERVEVGVFSKVTSITFDDLMQSENLDKFLIPIPKVFDKMPKMVLNSNDIKKLCDGQTIKTTAQDGFYLVFDGETLVCVAEASQGNFKLKTYLRG